MERYVELDFEGQILRGMMHVPDGASEAAPCPFVVIFHGFCDDAAEINFVHTELSRRLCDEGIGSVRFSFLGNGDSEGAFDQITVSSEVNQGLAILDFARSQPFVDTSRVAVHGLSLGGCVASMVAGLRSDDLCALSMWCPAPDVVYNLQKHKTLCGDDASSIVDDGVFDVEGLPLGIAFYEDALTLDPFAIASKFQGPVNIVHGDADITASPECSYTYKEIFGDRARLTIVHGAEHRFKSFAWRAARMDSAVDFLKEICLAK